MFSIVQNAPRTLSRSGLRAVVASSRYMGTRSSSSSTMHENDPELLDREKARNLNKTQHKTSTPHEHAPGWNEHLASTSEAFIKADKSETSKDELQAETVKYVKARHHEDGSDTLEAYYHRDEVSGPLSSKGKEEVIVHNGKVAVDRMIDDPVAAAMIRNMNPTQSEINVKSDRQEV